MRLRVVRVFADDDVVTSTARWTPFGYRGDRDQLILADLQTLDKALPDSKKPATTGPQAVMMPRWPPGRF